MPLKYLKILFSAVFVLFFCAIAWLAAPRLAFAGSLTSVSATPVTAGTDNIIGQSNTSWRFAMTNATALATGTVVQVIFPSITDSPPFTFSSPAVTATTSITATTTVAVGGGGNLNLGIVVLAFVPTSTAFNITINGINNPFTNLSKVSSLNWTFKTGTPQGGGAAGDDLTIIDGPATATASLARKGSPIVSDANSGITPSSYAASATNVTYTFTFTASTTIPVGGKIAINFPSEFNLANATTTDQNDINGAAAGAPKIASTTLQVVTGVGQNRIIYTTSASSTNAGDLLTVTVSGLTNPALGVYRPFFIYTTTAGGGLVDGAASPGDDQNNYQVPPLDTIHIGGNNTMNITVYKESGGSNVVLSGGELTQVKVGIGCPDKQFFVGFHYLSSTSTTTYANLLDCNYKIGVMPASSTNSSFFDSFLQPGMVDVPATGGVTKSISLVFGAPDAAITGSLTGGVASATGIDIRGYNGKYESWMPVFTSTAYTTPGLDGSGNGYFRLKAKAGSTWKLNMIGGVLTSGANKYWPPVLPSVYVTSTTSTTTLGSFAYALADNTLTVTLKNASTGATINSATCVGVKRTGGGVFMGDQEMHCDANSGSDFQFKVPLGDITVSVMRAGVGQPEEYPVAITSGTVTKTIYISAPTNYISVTVKDSSNTPINGAPIFAHGSNGFSQVMTGSLGTATIYVSPGTYTVEGFAPGLGPLTAQAGVVVSSGVNPLVTFTVNTSGYKSITGTVTQGGSGLGGVQIGAFGVSGTNGGNSTITNSDGTYVLRVPAGTYKVGGWSQSSGGLSEQSVNVSSGNASGINWTLGAVGTLQITVVGGGDVSSLFAGAFDATYGRGNGTDVWTTSGSDKVAKISLPAGTYNVHVGSPVFGELTSAGETAVITAGATTAKSYSVSTLVTMVALSGNVSSGATNIENANVWVSRVGGSGFYSALTDASGNYSIKIPDARNYRVGVKKLGYVAVDQNLAISGATTTNFSLTSAGSSITGKITSDGSTGIAGSWVSAKKTGSEVWIGTPTDAGGNYSLPVDSSSLWTVYADAPCYLRSTGLSASAGDANKNITLSANSSCSASTPEVRGITASTGGSVNNGDSLKMDIPANALGTDSGTISISVSNASMAKSSSNATPLAHSVQSIVATNSSSSPITTLNTKVSFTLKYNTSDLPPGFDEKNLQLGYRDSTTGQWEPVAATVDATLHTITAQVDHFTDYGPILPGVPEVPQNLAASAASPNQINLTWNSVSNTTYYDIYRSTVSGSGFTAIASSSSASYSSVGLTAGTAYYYKITAVNSNGFSAYSNEATANAQAASVSTSGGGGGGITVIGPTNTSVVIADGAATTTSVSVTLTLSATNANQMMIANNSDFSGGTWFAYATSSAWTLSSGNGIKTVYAKFKDLSGNISIAVSDRIALTGQATDAPATIPITPTASTTPAIPAAVGASAPTGAHPNGTLVLDGKTVYLIKDGQRYGFRDAKEYQSHGYNFGQAVAANAQDKALPMASGNIIKALEGTLALDASDNRTVYMIGLNGVKRGFVSMAVFKGLGYNLSGVPKINLTDYSSGTPINSASEAHPEGALVKEGKTIWWIRNGQKIGFESMQVFNTYGFSLGDVTKINMADTALPQGPLVKFRDGTLVKDGSNYFLISDGKKLPFASASVLTGKGYKTANAISASLSGYESGGNVKVE